MKIIINSAVLLSLSICSTTTNTHAFSTSSTSPAFRSRTISSPKNALYSTPDPNDPEQLKKMGEILREEALNPETMKETAERMKNMSQSDLDDMLNSMGNMTPAQEQTFKAMGMNPDLMKTTMNMMKENPGMMKSAQEMMSNMTPEQLMEQSKAAQAQMDAMSEDEIMNAASVTAEAFKSGTAKPLTVEAKVEKEEEEEEETPKTTTDGVVLGSAKDPKVIDTLFAMAQYLSTAPAGGVTLNGFRTLPPIQLLSGDREFDLSKQELQECWDDGSKGESIVDRAGFERVWEEVCELFEDDVMDEARKTANAVKKKVRSAAAAAATTEIVPDPSEPVIGQALTPEQLKFTSEQVKNMTDEDTKQMLDQMANISPMEAARMKAMGVDTDMMKKSAEMMRDNPLMRKAAQAMMKNMNPEQMMKMSQQAQEQMKGMSKEDFEEAMKRVESSGKE